MHMFGVPLFDILYLATPVLLAMVFGINLYLYGSAKKQDKQVPGAFSPEEVKERKILLLVSLVIAGALFVLVGGFMLLLYSAVFFD